MVIFWNFAGVPFVGPWNYFGVVIVLIRKNWQTYVYSVVYMASHEPEKYQFSTPTYIALFTTLLTAYYVWVAEKDPTFTRDLTP